MVMLPNLAPTMYIDATPLATDRPRTIPLAVEPSARLVATAATVAPRELDPAEPHDGRSRAD